MQRNQPFRATRNSWLQHNQLLLTTQDGWLPASHRTGNRRGVGCKCSHGRRGQWLREASWLVYPVLVLGGLKLLVEDFPAGRPLTLLIALALYGGALVLAPRLARKRKTESGASAPPAGTDT